MGGPTVAVMGRVHARDGDRVADQAVLRGAHARIAFAYLVLERRRPVHREELADAVWGWELPPTWRSALRTAVSHVRAFLGGVWPEAASLKADGGCYDVALAPGTVVDVEAARAALVASARLLDEGADAEAEARGASAAETLCQPFLPGVESEWVDGVRRRLDADAVRALEVLAVARARLGDAAGALGAADQALARDPFREPVHQAKIRALLGERDRAGALFAYRRCRELFLAELRIEPGLELQRLAASALRGGAEPSAATARGVS